jgi:hypothetical protein
VATTPQPVTHCLAQGRERHLRDPPIAERTRGDGPITSSLAVSTSYTRLCCATSHRAGGIVGRRVDHDAVKDL